MKQVAFIDNLGEIKYIISPGGDDDYVDGQVYGDYTAKDIPSDSDPTSFMQENHWNGTIWEYRGLRPSIFHKWTASDGWIIDGDFFLQRVRAERDRLLAVSDWTQVADSPLTTEEMQAWASYRQSLRDLPSTILVEESFEEISWPTPPNS